MVEGIALKSISKDIRVVLAKLHKLNVSTMDVRLIHSSIYGSCRKMNPSILDVYIHVKLIQEMADLFYEFCSPI